jgi:outer membrane protein assembly factor BamD (BamD/ComL family)/Tfp pilus assembly protein PilF
MRLLPLLFLLTLASSATAQRPARPLPADETSLAAQFGLADNFLRAGQTERAIGLLEDLMDANPGQFAIYAKLRYAYETAKQYDRAAALVEARMERQGEDPALLADLGTLRFLQGDEPAATAAWDRAVAARPDHPNAYRAVYGALSRVGLPERAIELLNEGRERIGEADLFQGELSQLYLLTADFERAADELLPAVEDDPARWTIVRSRFSGQIEDEAAASALREALRRAVRKHPLNRGYRDLQAWLGAETGDWDAALDAVRAVDRLEGEFGQTVYQTATAALLAGSLDAAEQGYAYILDRHPESPMVGPTRLQRAVLLERRAENASGVQPDTLAYRAALDAYLAYAEQYPHDPVADRARRDAARLYRDVFGELSRARTLFAGLAQSARNRNVQALARLDLGEVALLQNDLPAARAAFTEVEEGERIGEAAETARIELALLDFYQGEFDGALARVRAMHENTATDAANDAIGLKLLLMEHGADTKDAEPEVADSLARPLRLYAAGRLALRQSHAARAQQMADSLLATYPGHPITDEAAFLRAESLRLAGQTDAALAAFDRVAQTHPDSYLADRAVFLRAETLERDRRDAAAAIDAYADFLARYPGSLRAPDARVRLRTLRGDADRARPDA